MLISERLSCTQWVVNNRVDESNANGLLSLREAIVVVQSDATLDTITFDATVFNGGTNSLIRLTQGELEITEDLSIDGTSVGGVVITGDANGDDVTLPGTYITDVSASFGGTDGAVDDLLDDNSRVLNVNPDGFPASPFSNDLALAGVTITGGRTTAFPSIGNGIRFTSSGELSLTNSTLSGNSTTSSGGGGGIFTSSGAVSLFNSTLSGNSTTPWRWRWDLQF